MTRRLSATLLLVALSVLLVAAGGVPPFRYARPLSAPRGWSRVDVPDDMLDACRPGLPDLRILGPEGAELPYMVEQAQAPIPEQWTVRDVETAGGETIGIVDRGTRPSTVAIAQVALDADEYLKPIVLESSNDRAAWRELARSSIFASGRARSAALRFVPDDKRYWRVRLDDRLAAPVPPRAVMTYAGAEEPRHRDVVIPIGRRSVDGAKSVYSVALPSGAITRIALAPREAAFSRAVAVYERVLFRDERVRRLLGAAKIARAPGQRETLGVPLGDVASRVIEIEIDDDAAAPLTLTEVTATIEARALLVYTVAGAGLEMVYGTPQVGPPRYDLGASIALGRPERIGAASLGPPIDRGAPVVVMSRGPAVDSAQWRTRVSLHLPAAPERGEGLAFVTLDGIDGADADVRLIDAESRQVPFVHERADAAGRTSRRIDFLFAPGDELTLLAGNPGAPPAALDLASLADALLTGHPEEATIRSGAAAPPPNAHQIPRWMWGSAIAAALLLAIAVGWRFWSDAAT